MKVGTVCAQLTEDSERMAACRIKEVEPVGRGSIMVWGGTCRQEDTVGNLTSSMRQRGFACVKARGGVSTPY